MTTENKTVKRFKYLVELSLTDEFIKRWIVENPFFGEGEEDDYAVGYVKNALRNYIVNHLPDSIVEGIEFTVSPPCDEDCFLFRQNVCTEAGRDPYCTREHKPTNAVDGAGAVIR